jgi:hypothetical protein
MSRYTINFVKMFPTAVEKFANNGQPVSASAGKMLANKLNQVAGRRVKVFGVWGQDLGNVSSGAGSASWYRSAFITGPVVTGVRIYAGFALTDYAPTTPPGFAIQINTTAGASVAAKTIYFYGTGSTAVTPDGIKHCIIDVEGLSGNTEYYAHISTLDGVRPVYMTTCERYQLSAVDSVAGYSSPGAFVADGPIYYTHYSKLVTAANGEWKHGGKHLITYQPDLTLSSVYSLTSTSYVNIFDGASSVASSSAGYTLNTAYDGTYSRANAIPVKLLVRAQRTAGAGTLSLQATDGTNSVAITGVGSGSAAWYSTTATIPAQTDTKWDLQAKVSAGGTTFDIFAVSFLEYES